MSGKLKCPCGGTTGSLVEDGQMWRCATCSESWPLFVVRRQGTAPKPKKDRRGKRAG